VVAAPTRMFHWLFALSFVGAYLTADGERWRAMHVTLGYTLAGLLVFRLLYGLFGPRQAGLAVLWRKVTGAPAWLRSVLQSPTQAPWRQSQNLLMALAVVLLLLLVLPLTLSGYATYNEWGGDWLEEVHEFFGNTFGLVVLAHVALIAGLSLVRRKNQALPMLTGRIEGAGPDLVKNNRAWLAGLLLVAVLAFAAWEWQASPQGLVPTSAWAGGGSGQGHDDDDD
ncbi:MAG: cytochrome b/b6 domain-containing protein, partial [Rubrivivax sp.]|nr:cytochrome b/b6 domain-containing protein [Rubrivivax sp.]